MKFKKDHLNNIREIKFEESDIFMELLNVKAFCRDDVPLDVTFHNTVIYLPDTPMPYKIGYLGIRNIPEMVGASERDDRFSNCIIKHSNNNLYFDECDFTDFRMDDNQKIFYVTSVKDCMFPDGSTIIYTVPVNVPVRSVQEFFIDDMNNSYVGRITIHVNFNGLWQTKTFI